MMFVIMCIMIGGKVSSLTMQRIKSLTAAIFSSSEPEEMRVLSYSRLGGVSKGFKKYVHMLISYVFDY